MLAKRFDTARYLIDHPDIAAAGLDPWRHYHEHGWREGRKFRLLSMKRDPLIGSPARDGIQRAN
jgi:hypothetical protein